MPGLVAARVGAESVILTDGSDVVMRLLKRQREAFVAKHSVSQGAEACGEVLAHKLEWGSSSELEGLKKLTGSNGETLKPSVLIGADVVCWPACIEPLLDTTKALFLDLADPFEGVLYIG